MLSFSVLFMYTSIEMCSEIKIKLKNPHVFYFLYYETTHTQSTNNVHKNKTDHHSNYERSIRETNYSLYLLDVPSVLNSILTGVIPKIWDQLLLYSDLLWVGYKIDVSENLKRINARYHSCSLSQHVAHANEIR